MNDVETQGLTLRQRDCLMVIISYLRERNVSPTYQEIMTALGIKSKSSVVGLLRRLEQRGFIEIKTACHRSIKLTTVVSGNPDSDLKDAAIEMLSELTALYMHVADEYRERADAKINRWQRMVNQ